MSRSSVVLGLVVGALLGTALVLWTLETVEVVPEIKKSPPVPSVAADPWTGFVRGLDGEGAVQRYSSLDDIDWDEASLVVVRWEDLEDQDPENQGPERWLTWVGQGWHLWVTVETGSWSGPWTEAGPFAGVSEGDGVLASDATVEASSGDGSTVTVSSSRWWKVADAAVEYRVAGKTALAVWNQGSGWLMLSGPPVAVENGGLGSEGNRRFAAALTDGVDPETLWVPSPKAGPAATSSRGTVVPLVVGLVVFFVLLFWSLGPRFGPVLVATEPARLGLAERLRAEARFLWAQGHRSAVADWARNISPTKGKQHDD